MNADSRRLIIALAFIAVFSGVAVGAGATAEIDNLSSLDVAAHVALFEVPIIVELPDQLKDKPLQFQMAKWSPGRYGVFDFAKNVQEFRANAAA